MREIGEIGLVAFDDGRVCSEHHVRQIVGSLNGHFRRRRRYRWPKIEAHELALERERPILIELLLLYSSSPNRRYLCPCDSHHSDFIVTRERLHVAFLSALSRRRTISSLR